jgi:N-acetylglucosamine transport system permease protein
MASTPLRDKEPIARVAPPTKTTPVVTRRRPRISLRKLTGWLPLYGLLLLWGLFIAVPIAWVFMSALKTNRQIIASPWGLPTTWEWQNFQRAWVESSFSGYFVNSVLLTVVSTFIGTLISVMAAYVITRYAFRGQRTVYYYILVGLFVPFFLTLIPTYKLFNDLGMLETRLMSYVGLALLYIAWSIPWSVFILSGYFSYLPGELMDAAWIDGANDFQVFTQVMLPIARGGVTAMTIFNALWIWNDFVLALVFLPYESQRTMPVGLMMLFKAKKALADWSAVLAAVVIMVLPMVIIYTIMQKQVVQGATAGALKG